MTQCALCDSTAHSTPDCKWRNTCASCTHMDLRSSRLRTEGLISCKADRRGYAFKSPRIERVCAKRIDAADDVTKKRVAWIEGRA
jgi:hypothetical protein